ncbi:MAG: M23 family metallopeptidase [Bacteroidota bacterium]
MKYLIILLAFGFILLNCSCEEEPELTYQEDCIVFCPCPEDDSSYQEELDCTGQTYPDPSTSPYIVPFFGETSFSMGLANCSSSFHGAGRPDQHAYDFDLPTGTLFLAARGGKVVKVVNDQPSGGGGVGNYVVVDHDDDTFGLYYHSPENGIHVSEGDSVRQGQPLGEVGRSGLAGYPHLHFIVVRERYRYPYEGVAVNFNNIYPLVTVPQSYTDYTVCP